MPVTHFDSRGKSWQGWIVGFLELIWLRRTSRSPLLPSDENLHEWLTCSHAKTGILLEFPHLSVT